MNTTFQMTDPAVLMKAAVNDKETFQELSSVFLRIVPELLSSLEEAVANGHPDKIAERAHALKGCVFLVGGQHIGERLQAIEREARHSGTVCGADEFQGIKNDLLIAYDEVKSFSTL